MSVKIFLPSDLNENPGGLPQEFVDEVTSQITPQLIAQYPETLHFTKVLASHLNVGVEIFVW